ncbi:MAG: MarR family transcriptional regulator [Chloroflexota bacterium]|nr:MarR family transcriptional regulator [Chloroflexota bacterium]
METDLKSSNIAAMCNKSIYAWLLLERVYDKMQRHLMTHLGHYDLTTAQYDVLAHLSESPGITQQALAEQLLVTKGNICGLIDRMSSRGLVERRCDPEDRRSNLLYLTPGGQAIAEEAVPAYSNFVREHLASLSAADQAALSSILERLDHGIDHH